MVWREKLALLVVGGAAVVLVFATVFVWSAAWDGHLGWFSAPVMGLIAGFLLWDPARSLLRRFTERQG